MSIAEYIHILTTKNAISNNKANRQRFTCMTVKTSYIVEMSTVSIMQYTYINV